MGKIDIHNYEAYLLDLSEGCLSGDLQIELELFLIQHPELHVDLSELSLVPFEAEEVLFPEKTNLKKSPADLIPETQFISYIERQLAAEDQAMLEKSCALNPALATQLKLYQHTVLE